MAELVSDQRDEADGNSQPAGHQQDRPHGGVANGAASFTDTNQHGRQEHGHDTERTDEDRHSAAGLLASAEQEQDARGEQRQGDAELGAGGPIASHGHGFGRRSRAIARRGARGGGDRSHGRTRLACMNCGTMPMTNAMATTKTATTLIVTPCPP